MVASLTPHVTSDDHDLSYS